MKKYSIEGALEIAKLSAEFEGEMQLLKRGGLVHPGRKPKIEELLRRMVPYRDVFEPYLEKYIKNDKGVRDYERMINFQIPLE